MNYHEFILSMSKFIARKEQLVEAFIATISDLDSKSCDEIENNLYEIIKNTRGLIYADQYRRKTNKYTDSDIHDFPIQHTGTDIMHTSTTMIPQHEKTY
jgi:hypothetical protein